MSGAPSETPLAVGPEGVWLVNPTEIVRLDPRTVAPDDPRLRNYEGVLPGFDAVAYLPEGNPAEWLDWMRAAGVDVPEDWRAFVDLPDLGLDIFHYAPDDMAGIIREFLDADTA